MVNFGLNSASLLGIFLAVAGASLYFLRTVKPELSRDQDIFFAAVGLLCGFILLFQGWRLDPILQFGQFLLTGTTVFFAVESIRLRGVATEQARKNSTVVDNERPVSRVYRAELDKMEDYPPREERYDRRLRGTPDERTSRPNRYEAAPPRSRTSRPNSPQRPPQTSRRPPSRGSRPEEGPASYGRYDAWSEGGGDAWSGTQDYGWEGRSPDNDNRSGGRRPNGNGRPSGREDNNSPYVDYQPVDEAPGWEEPETPSDRPNGDFPRSDFSDDREEDYGRSSDRPQDDYPRRNPPESGYGDGDDYGSDRPNPPVNFDY